MLWNSNTVIRQKAEDVSTAIFRGSGRTSRLHWIICFAICSQTGSWLKQADCSYSYQHGLVGHTCEQCHSVLRTQAQLLITDFLYDSHCVSSFSTWIPIHPPFTHKVSSCTPWKCALFYTTRHAPVLASSSLCLHVNSNLCEFSRRLALQWGERYIFRINRKNLLL